jgi:hypothetical protein
MFKMKTGSVLESETAVIALCHCLWDAKWWLDYNFLLINTFQIDISAADPQCGLRTCGATSFFVTLGKPFCVAYGM